MVLDGPDYRLRLPDPVGDYDPDTQEPRLTARNSAFVLVTLGDNANTAAAGDWCPACGERNAIRYLGTGAAALAAASITQLFTGGELDEEIDEDETLVQPLRAGRRAPGWIRRQPLLHVLAARAALEAPRRGPPDRAQRPDRGRRGGHD
jgi:hypothetical protein